MIFLLLLFLFVLKFHEPHPYLNYLIAAVLVLLFFSLLVIAVSALQLEANLEIRDGRYHEGDEVPMKLVIEHPFFHGLLQPEIRVENRTAGTSFTLPRTLIRDNTAEIPLKGMTAGTNRVSVSRCRVYGLFRVFFFPRRVFLEKDLNIYPAACTVNPSNLRQRYTASEGETMLQKGDDYHELYEIRPFEEGDDLRYMHRSLSARYEDYIMKVGSSQRHLRFTFFLRDDPDFAVMKNELGQLYNLCRQVIGQNSDGFLLTYRGRDRQIYAWSQFYDFIDGVYRNYVKG